MRFCTDAGPGWKALSVKGIDAAVLGRGEPVVLLNESDNDPCAWTSFASTLAGGGHRVAVFRYTSAAAADEPRRWTSRSRWPRLSAAAPR